MNPLLHPSMLSRGVPDQFAGDWIAAWNAHDVRHDPIDYRDDVPGCSRLHSRPARGARWRAARPPRPARLLRARAGLYTDLYFEPLAGLSGVNSIALHYRSVEGREAIEVMELDARRQVHRAAAHYTAALPKRTQ